MFSGFVIRWVRENEGFGKSPFLVIIAHVHLSYLICFTERPRQGYCVYQDRSTKAYGGLFSD